MKWIKQLACFAALLSGAAEFAEPQDLAQALNPYLNQKLIQRSYGNEQNIKIKLKDLKRPAGNCDVAVEVLDVQTDEKRIVFRLEQIGHIRIGGASRCRNVWAETTFTITDLGGIAPQDLASDLQDVFLTPEAYLARNGHPLNLDQPPNNVPGTSPKVVLLIDPTLPEKARHNRVREGHVAARGIVRSDGKIDSASIVSDPGYGLGEQALRVLPLWRFEPARKDNKAIDCVAIVEFSFISY